MASYEISLKLIWRPKHLVTLLNAQALYKQTYLSIYLLIYLRYTTACIVVVIRYLGIMQTTLD